MRLGHNSGSTDRNTYLSFYRGGTERRGYIMAASASFQFFNDVTNDYLYLSNININNINALKWYDASTTSHNTVWHSGNDGPGSGLNADLFDNLGSGSFMRSDADDTVTGHTEWQDNKQIRLGNGADDGWYHTGSHSYFDHYTGSIYHRNYAHGVSTYFQGEDGAGTLNALLYLQDNLYVRLFYDGSERMRTDGSGVTVYGRLHADDAMYVGKNGGGDSWTYFYDDNSNTWRSFGWDDSQNAFVAEENDGGVHKLALVFTGSSNTETNYPVGTPLLTAYTSSANINASVTVSRMNSAYFKDGTGGTVLSGTWRARGRGASGVGSIVQRVA